MLFSLKNIGRNCFLLLLTITLIVMWGGDVKGQRVYANDEKHSTKKTAILVTLSEVADPTKAVEAPTTDFSKLFSGLDILGLLEAWQILKFTTTDKPIATTPITIKFGSNTSLLGLLNGIGIQPTLNDNLVPGTQYNSQVLLDLLSLLQDNKLGEITLPAPLQDYDGVRLKIGGLVSVAINANLYYAFFIAAPKVPNSSTCTGVSVTLTVTNPQVGYTYNWYSSNRTTILQSGSNINYTPTPNSTTTYYVEAVESSPESSYYSGKTPITVTVLPKPHSVPISPQVPN